jgi:hypothetical protein
LECFGKTGISVGYTISDLDLVLLVVGVVLEGKAELCGDLKLIYFGCD